MFPFFHWAGWHFSLCAWAHTRAIHLTPRADADSLNAIIDRWKDRGLTPEKVPTGEIGTFANGRALAFYKLYRDRLRTLNACDFGDLLLHMLTIFRTHPDVLEQYRDRFRYILVDDYQDTNQ